MASKKDKGEPVGWVTVKGKHFPKWADGTIGWQDGEDDKTHKARQKAVEQATKEANKAVKKADKDWEEYHAKQQAQESLEHKRNIALDKIAKMKDLDEYDREDIEYLYKDTGGAWVHSDAMERAIEAPLSGRKTATEKSLRRNFDSMMRAWEDTAYTTQSKEGKAFLEKEMKGYKDRFEANMQQWSGKDKQRKTASVSLERKLAESLKKYNHPNADKEAYNMLEAYKKGRIAPEQLTMWGVSKDELKALSEQGKKEAQADINAGRNTRKVIDPMGNVVKKKAKTEYEKNYGVDMKETKTTSKNARYDTSRASNQSRKEWLKKKEQRLGDKALSDKSALADLRDVRSRLEEHSKFEAGKIDMQKRLDTLKAKEKSIKKSMPDYDPNKRQALWDLKIRIAEIQKLLS